MTSSLSCASCRRSAHQQRGMFFLMPQQCRSRSMAVRSCARGTTSSTSIFFVARTKREYARRSSRSKRSSSAKPSAVCRDHASSLRAFRRAVRSRCRLGCARRSRWQRSLRCRAISRLQRPSIASVWQPVRSVPIFMAHGTSDPIVPLARGVASRDALVAAGHVVEWHQYPMPHSVNEQEIRDIAAFLKRVLA